MADTAIQWTDAVWNPVTGCTKVSQGCKFCYAERVAQRWWKGRKFTDVQTHPDRLDQPLRWRKPRRVFVNSMSDLFHEAVHRDFILRVFLAMQHCPQHSFQVLTKRPERMRAIVAEWLRPAMQLADAPRLCAPTWPLPNVWLGVSCEDQATADERIPLLLDTPAAVRFVSCEPMIGPVDLRTIAWKRWDNEREGHFHDCGALYLNALSGTRATSQHGTAERITPLDWIIVGGESGSGARPCDVAWIRSIVEQCKAAAVPCFVKQLGAAPTIARGVGATARAMAEDEHRRGREWPDGTHFGNRTGDVNLNGRVALLRDPKGGDPAEWPDDLRVREWPKEEPRG